MPDLNTKATIIELALTRFNQDVLPAEKKLFQSAEVGAPADCSAFSQNGRTIRSDRLSWLCTDREATAHITSRGVGPSDKLARFRRFAGASTSKCLKIRYRFEKVCTTGRINRPAFRRH
jgi:hypothetical protein